MGTASIHEGVRRMRFSDLLEQTESKALTQEAASECLGVSVRTFQHWSERYEAEGDDGLVDRCMGRRAAAGAGGRTGTDAGALPGQVRRLHGEALPRATAKTAWLCAGLHGDEARLARVGLGAKGAKAFGAPQEASTSAAAGDDAAPGRIAPRLARRPAGDGPDRYPGRCDERGLLDAAGRGRKDGVDVPGLGRGGWRAWPVLRALHRSRQPLLLHCEGWREGLEGATNPSGTGFIASWDRAYRGLFAAGARALRADVRHAAGPAAEGPATGRNHDGRSRQCVVEAALHRPA